MLFRSDTSKLPLTMSPQVQQQLKFPAEQMQSMGYAFDGTRWKLGGTPQQPNAGQPSQAQNPGGNTDFNNTNFMQYNQAHNVAFNNQLRWDPQRKKYVQIGKLIAEGKLDQRGGWHNQPTKAQRIAQRNAQKNKGAPAPSNQGTAQINFGAGTG